MKANKTILIICATPVEREPRVIRQYESLKKAGFNIIVAGYFERNNSNIFGENTISIGLNKFEARSARILLVMLNLIYFQLPPKFRSQLTDRFVLNILFNLTYLSGVKPKMLIQKIQSQGICDLEAVISHDHLVSYAGKRISKVFKAKHVIDFHEHPLSQYQYKENWEKNKNFIRAIISTAILDSYKLIFVSDGIKTLISEEFNIPKEKSVVIRSLPRHENILKSYKNGKLISLIYVGNINPTRGLENAIMMMKFLPNNYRLYLQGYGEKQYINELKDLSRREANSNRVYFLDPVPFHEIIQSISLYDIGYFVCDNFGPQREFSLPNKIFMYIMSELCVVSSNFQEIANVITEYNCGRVVDKFQPLEIAKVINAISRDQLSIFQKNSATAKLDLCWEHEESKLLKLFDG